MIKMIVRYRVMSEVRRLINIAKEKVTSGGDEYEWFDYVNKYLDFIWNAKINQ